MAFRIGQIVECVDEGSGVYDPSIPCPLVKGQRYEVAGVKISNGGFPACCVVGVSVHGLRTWFNQARFRPVTEQKRETSISIFKEILDRENHGLPSRVDYPADCEPK